MVGRDVVLNVDKTYQDLSQQKAIYQVEGLSTLNHIGNKVLNNISFTIKEGEILGVAGVEGNGQSELSKVLSGLMLATEGTVVLDDKNITNYWPNELRNQKVSFIPEDRFIDGLCKDMSISQNMIAGNHWDKKYFKHNLYNQKVIDEERDRLVDLYDIRISDVEGDVSSLSGGNAQKVLIAREFARDPKMLVISQPTRGVDVGSIEYIHKEILKMQQEGKAILLISSELSEIMSLSDRIIVMYKGEIYGEVHAKGASKEEIGLLMAGIKKEEKE